MEQSCTNGTFEEIGLLKGGRVTVDGAFVNLPFTWRQEGASALIRRSPRGDVYLSSELGVDLVHNGLDRAEVQLLSRHRQQVRGMCGNFNGDRRDDLVRPDGTLARSMDDLGNSWVRGRRFKRAVEDNCVRDSGSASDCMPGSRAYQDAQSFCRPLAPQSDVFAACFRRSQLHSESFFRSCAIDVCANGPRVACVQFQNVAALCAERGTPTEDWRTRLGCQARACGANMEYQKCGTSCPKTVPVVPGRSRRLAFSAAWKAASVDRGSS